MAQILEYLKIAFMNIKMNKGRSFLTMLGIIIGISSVILIITVGNGVKNPIIHLSDLGSKPLQKSPFLQTLSAQHPQKSPKRLPELCVCVCVCLLGGRGNPTVFTSQVLFC